MGVIWYCSVRYLAAGHHAQLLRQRGGYARYAVDGEDAVQVAFGQTALERRAHGLHGQLAGAQALKLGGDLSRGALHHGDQGDDGHYADDDAQHRQEGAHLVAADVGQRHAQAFPKHRPPPPRKARRPECAPAGRHFAQYGGRA